jgi:hypothetical protein
MSQACRNEKVRKEVASAIIKAITNNEVAKSAEIPTQNVVIRFSEA